MRRIALLWIALVALSCSERAERAGPAGVDPAERERLRALGYVEVVDERAAAHPRGVSVRDAARMAPGRTFFTNALDGSAQLVEADGTLVHEWRLAPVHKWGNALLLPDGDVLAVHWNPPPRAGGDALGATRDLVRIGWDGALRWRWRLPLHHDVDVLPDGHLATLTYALRVVPAVDPDVPVRDNGILRLDASGREVGSASLVDLLLALPSPFALQPIRPRKRAGATEIDLLHANSLEWLRRPGLAASDPLYAMDRVLVCVRNQDLVAIVDWPERRIAWWWGPGELASPHDATLLANGNVLVFDNGLGRGWSRVVEVDPRRDAIVWEYRAPEPRTFYSATRGAAQRLANGNTLVTESTKGRIFEITADGEIVWEYWNPNLSADGKPLVVTRARRVVSEPDGSARFAPSD